jgi:glutamine synthetase
MLEKMLFVIPYDEHDEKEIIEQLNNHPEVKFVSLVGLDIGGHDTDEKIPVALFKKDIRKFLKQGVQTDGSSVILPKIAAINNAKVDIVPDLNVNWYVDYNFKNIDDSLKLPVGTLRIPSFLVHNDSTKVGSREILNNTSKYFKTHMIELLTKYPKALEDLAIDSADEIEEIILTGATELEFWVKTPEDKGDREQLSTSQELKEQYWQRTRGHVRTALERTIVLLDYYGFGVEMGHKEVGGIKAKLGNSGEYSHIMEQLEIDWRFDHAVQASDNELIIKYIIKGVFRMYGLEFSFMAKPIDGVAGSGMHTHMGVAARLKDGRKVNLFSPKKMDDNFLSAIGFGALMGLLKNYEVVNPFVSATNDALERLKVGFEAPICTVTSLGHSVEAPSRNRTVLIGLVRDSEQPLATRFELRAPNPKSNTYLVMATSYLAMLDGIDAAIEAGKGGNELLSILSKKKGEEVFYLEKERVYRSEKDVFEEYTQDERRALFGEFPATVYENIAAFEKHPEKLEMLKKGDVFDDTLLLSYSTAILQQWAMELHGRIIPNTMDYVRECVKLHTDDDSNEADIMNWTAIQDLRLYLGKDNVEQKCLLTRIKNALSDGKFEEASNLQKEMQREKQLLKDTYLAYKKNIL